MKFSIKSFFSKRDQIRSFLRIRSHLQKKSLMETFILYAVSDSDLLLICADMTELHHESAILVEAAEKVPVY